MSRAQRLLDLIQVLRRHRHPVSGATLAEATGVSLRTLYRDIELLKAEGAHIDGEAGVGYVLRPGFMLPPLMFSEEEIEALVLGSRWVHQRADRALADAAANVLAKIGAVLPKDLRDTLDESGLLIGPGDPIAAGDAQLPKIRQAIRTERKIGLSRKRVEWSEEQHQAEPPAEAATGPAPKEKKAPKELKGGLGGSGPLISPPTGEKA